MSFQQLESTNYTEDTDQSKAEKMANQQQLNMRTYREEPELLKKQRAYIRLYQRTNQFREYINILIDQLKYMRFRGQITVQTYLIIKEFRSDAVQEYENLYKIFDTCNRYFQDDPLRMQIIGKKKFQVEEHFKLYLRQHADFFKKVYAKQKNQLDLEYESFQRQPNQKIQQTPKRLHRSPQRIQRMHTPGKIRRNLQTNFVRHSPAERDTSRLDFPFDKLRNQYRSYY